MSKEIKAVRGQLRQIVKDILPEVLVAQVMVELDKRINAKLEALSKHVKDTMTHIDDRAKDIQGYMVRQATIAAPLTPAETSENTPKA